MTVRMTLFRLFGIGFLWYRFGLKDMGYEPLWESHWELQGASGGAIIFCYVIVQPRLNIPPACLLEKDML